MEKYSSVSILSSDPVMTNYQTIDIDQEYPATLNQTKKSNRIFVVLITGIFVAGAIGLFTSFHVGSNIYKNNLGDSTISSRVTCSAATTPLANIGWLQSSAVSFCKTSCKDPCSSYESNYGPLCCDWTRSADGGKTCSQSISNEGVCMCPISDISFISTTEPSPAPVEVPKSVPAPAEVPEKSTTPTAESKPHRSKPNRDDDWNNDWFSPMSWEPYKPIGKSDDSTPCKKKCNNPCGWSQSNGKSTCCEMTANGGCDITQVNGECYCGSG